jgi:hypothetical protein
MFAGIEHIGGGEAERIDGAVRDLHRAKQRRVDGGLNAQRLGGRQRLGSIPACWQAVIKVLICRIVFRQGNKQAAGGFNAVAGDAAQDAVFADALARRFAIGHRIARAAVQQAVITAGRPGGDIVALNQRRLQPRSAQSRAIPAPVAPPPIIMTSYSDYRPSPVLCVRFTSFSHIDRV